MIESSGKWNVTGFSECCMQGRETEGERGKGNKCKQVVVEERGSAPLGLNSAIHLPRNSELVPGNDVTPELNAFHLQVGFFIVGFSSSQVSHC